MKWNYRDVEITVTDQGRFVATVNGKRQAQASLAALKKIIDKEGKFEPFPAIVNSGGYTGYEVSYVTVIGINDRKFVDATGERHYRVIDDTPENRELVRVALELRQRNRAMIEDLNREMSEADSKIVQRSAD